MKLNLYWNFIDLKFISSSFESIFFKGLNTSEEREEKKETIEGDWKSKTKFRSGREKKVPAAVCSPTVKERERESECVGVCVCVRGGNEREESGQDRLGRGGVGPRTGITSFCRWKFVKGNVKRISGDSLSPVRSCLTGWFPWRI